MFPLPLFLFTNCQTGKPGPIKELIEGEVQNLHVNIHSGSVDFVSFDVLDDKDGKTYEIGMDEVNGSGFLDFNAYAYLDSTNLIILETKIISQPSGYLVVSPIQSVNNKIFITYTGAGQVDKILKTKHIVGKITNKTILTVGDKETQIKSYITNGGILKYLAPNLRKCLKMGLGADVDSLQTGAQNGKFFVYDIRMRD